VPQLQELIEQKAMDKYRELGGHVGIANHLKTDLKKGLFVEVTVVDGVEVPFALRKQIYGINVLPPAESDPFWRLVLNALSDRTLIILMIAAVVSIGIGIYQHYQVGREDSLGSWVEGIAILMAVIVVALVNSGNDWQKEKQFRKLNAKKDDREVQVVRNGIQQQLSIFEVVVGDLLMLTTGEVVPADGVLVETHSLKCDESGLTGENMSIKKNPRK